MKNWKPGQQGLPDPARTPAPALRRNTGGPTRDGALPAVVDEVLRTPGQPLDAATRARMEPAFGEDFSRVRVHNDARAAASAQAIDAQAYAVGSDLVFGSGRFAPQSASGLKLLAHELAHVAQPRPTGAARFSRPGDASEREAEHAAEAVSRGGAARPVTAGALIHRQPVTGVGDLPPLSGAEGLLENASPLLAAAVGSVTLDDFATGKSELKPAQQKSLAGTARNILILLRQYPLSTLSVTGYADTVDSEAKNLKLGEERAAACKQALVDLGVPEAIISTDSKGESSPQAVKTANETANARNRRVDVRFLPRRSRLVPLGPQLTLPTLKETLPSTGETKKKPIDLTYHPKVDPFDPTKPPPDLWKPVPPAPKGSGPKSVIDVIGEKFIDPVVDAVAGGLPKSVRDKIKSGARDGVVAGSAKGARMAAEAAGLKDPQGLDAIEKAAEAALKEKGKGTP